MSSTPSEKIKQASLEEEKDSTVDTSSSGEKKVIDKEFH
jgi:hypothetical protein